MCVVFETQFGQANCFIASTTFVANYPGVLMLAADSTTAIPYFTTEPFKHRSRYIVEFYDLNSGQLLQKPPPVSTSCLRHHHSIHVHHCSPSNGGRCTPSSADGQTLCLCCAAVTAL